MASLSPVQRSIAVAKELGYQAWPAERWVRRGGSRWAKEDLGGIIDYLMVGPDILAVQVTDGPHLAEHRTKLQEHPSSRAWVEAGGRLEIWSWHRVTKGGRTVRHRLQRLPYPFKKSG